MSPVNAIELFGPEGVAVEAYDLKMIKQIAVHAMTHTQTSSDLQSNPQARPDHVRKLLHDLSTEARWLSSKRALALSISPDDRHSIPFNVFAEFGTHEVGIRSPVPLGQQNIRVIFLAKDHDPELHGTLNIVAPSNLPAQDFSRRFKRSLVCADDQHAESNTPTRGPRFRVPPLLNLPSTDIPRSTQYFRAFPEDPVLLPGD